MDNPKASIPFRGAEALRGDWFEEGRSEGWSAGYARGYSEAHADRHVCAFVLGVASGWILIAFAWLLYAAALAALGGGL